MYKAIKEIGGYAVGDTVPAEKALAWKDMYAEPHIEEVKEKVIEKPVEKLKVVEKPKENLSKSFNKKRNY